MVVSHTKPPYPLWESRPPNGSDGQDGPKRALILCKFIDWPMPSKYLRRWMRLLVRFMQELEVILLSTTISGYALCHLLPSLQPALWFACDDKCSFAIAFKTPPVDHTAPSTSEHSVLCGILMPILPGGSLLLTCDFKCNDLPRQRAVFCNSTNEDLKNLMKYLDAVLHPASMQAHL